MPKKRQKMNYKKSRRDFSRKAGVHPKNDVSARFVMRGGIRL